MYICFQGSQFDTDQPVVMFFPREIYLSRSQLSLDPYISLCLVKDLLCPFLCSLFILVSIVHLMFVQFCWWPIISVGYDITRCLNSITVKRHHKQDNFYKRKLSTWHLFTFSEFSALSKCLGVWQHTDYQKRNVNTKPVTHLLIYKGDILPESCKRAMVTQWLWE